MAYILSVDGGGTKTEFCICDLDGNKKGSFLSGCSNYKSVGISKVYQSFREGLDQIETQMGIFCKDIVFSVWGISGCDSKNDFEQLEELIEKLGFVQKQFHLCNDGLLAFYAQVNEPGLVIIAGTGSIVFGIDAEGRMRRTGGWGYNVSDIGSGYWIGNEALKKTLLYCDGCGDFSPLFEKIRVCFGAEDFEALPYIITEVTDYFEIAKIALLVAELCESGEKISCEILKRGAAVLAGLVKSAYDRLEFNDQMELSIVFSGGVLKNKEYQTFLKVELEKQISLNQVRFFIQKNAPVYGGVRLAQKMQRKGE